MSDSIIKLEGVSKKYRLHHQSKERYTTLRDTVTRQIKGLFNPKSKVQNPKSDEDFWALNHVSFEIKQGEVVGIIGRNGAGKSTLLKILSRITEPSKGRVTLNGRVASLLEVGTGFHPELTGRENIFLNGAILGMRTYEIKAKFDEIVAFAEVERFLDTPVKRYSSGMYVRLAFAVAAHLEPEILVVDEVLAVGDAEFQKKCLGKMSEVARGGRTVLFVSHNMAAVNRLCESCVWLEKGQMVMRAPVAEAINCYLKAGLREGSEKTWATEDAPGDDYLRLQRVRICQPSGVTISNIDMVNPMQIEMDVHVKRPMKELSFALRIINAEGQIIIHTADILTVKQRNRDSGWITYYCTLPAFALNAGSYTVTIGADIPNLKQLFWLENVLSFDVESSSPEMGRYQAAAWVGILGPGLGSWRVESGNSTKI